MFRYFDISKNRLKSIELLKTRFLFKITICDLELKLELFWGVIALIELNLRQFYYISWISSNG